MAKRTFDHVALEGFEIKTQECSSLTFGLCEQELREHRQPVARGLPLLPAWLCPAFMV